MKVILNQSEGPSFLIEHIDRPKMDVDDTGVHVEFKMGEYRDETDMSTQGERAPTTCTLALASTFEFIEALLSNYSSNHKFDSSSIKVFIVLSKEPGCDKCQCDGYPA